jgi:hypothetical protein
MLTNIASSIATSGRRKILALSVHLSVLRLLVVVEWGIRQRSLPEVCDRLGLAFASPDPHHVARPAPDREWVARRVRAVARLLPLWPFGDTCLRRCLVLGALLAEVAPTLVIGVRRAEDQSVVAHSWLEISGRPVDPTAPSYAVLSS